jgi:hypothetical protein
MFLSYCDLNGHFMKERPSIQSALSRLSGKPAWKAVRNHGSIFFLEIGEPFTKQGLPTIHGEWHFLIECCHWRFETFERVLVGSEDAQQFIDSIFESLHLGSVERAEVMTPSHDLLIKFSSGIRFATFSTSAEATNQWTQWLLYGPPGENYAWVSDGGGNIKCITRDEPIRGER